MNRMLIAAMAILSLSIYSFSSTDTTFRFIFVPHVRSEDATNQTVNAGIAKIDFTKYSLKMLGGDLTPQTSKSRTTMKYLDSLFDLKNPNTLWSLGNHDLESGDSNLIKEFTGRQLFYSYARDGITFLVLNTEASAEEFTRTWIKSPQLDTVKAVCERVTSADTKFFIVLHSRYMWMINNTYFTQSMKDSIAASSKSMDTTNWYTDIAPQLKKVQAKGIQVLVFGGDKSQINVTYTKDSITYYAARMENTFTDSVNNVIILTYVKNTSITCNYVTLAKVNQYTSTIPNASVMSNNDKAFPLLKVGRSAGAYAIKVRLQTAGAVNAPVRMYALNGVLYQTFWLKNNETGFVRIEKPGIYVVRALVGTTTIARKIIVQ
jgi:hypothetical protein